CLREGRRRHGLSPHVHGQRRLRSTHAGLGYLAGGGRVIYVDHPTLGSKEFILRGIRIAGVNRAIESGRVTHPTLGDLQFWDGTLAALTVSASPTYVQGAVAVDGPRTITTASTTVSVDGGSPPYTYAWSVFDAGVG